MITLSGDVARLVSVANVWTAAQTFNDNVKLLLGTGLDAELYYDGTNVVLNPRAVGTGYLQALVSAIGATPADAIALWNATAAAAGAQQYSPALRFHGAGWATDGAGASQDADFRIYIQPIQGAANPTANLLFQSSINGAAFATRLTLGSEGRLRINTVSGAAAVYLNLDFEGVAQVQLAHNNTDAFLDFVGTLNFRSGVEGAFIASLATAGFASPNSDAAVLPILSRDSGVGLVEIGRIVGAADPYIQIGRDDTGVALNAVTDMLVLQAGGGTGNEAAGFGLGLSVKLGNAASQVEERGSMDWVLVTATDGAEDSRLDFNLMAGGAMNLAAQLSGAGILDVDLSSGLGAATVGLFDDYDDALILRQGISERKLEVLEKIGVIRRKDTGSGWMLNVQAMLYLLAGGIYQSRQKMDERFQALEHRMALIGG